MCLSIPRLLNVRMAHKFCFLGASPDTGNLGVSALYWSVVGGLARLDPGVELTVFDEGRGLRVAATESDGESFRYQLCGATRTRRVWQRRSFWNIRVSSWLGGLGNPAARCLRGADAVLDITGGDSFTDLYGPRRFRAGCAFKRFVLALGKPLILLPQTYGPYRDPRHREIAADICRRATLAWARDERSFATLKELLGDAFDPDRHRCGVDVAFALAARAPRAPLPEPLATWLASRGTDFQSVSTTPLPGREGLGEGVSVPTFPRSHVPTSALVGFNVSGLIWHDPVAMRDRYGFKADYRAVVLGFLRRLLAETDANIVLVPHVLPPLNSHAYESDPAANDAVVAFLREDADSNVRAAAAERVAAVPPLYGHPSEMKWLIAHCDWFCGTRMHACIAGLSSGVPTAAIAYSLKTQGVFETCGHGDCVIDPRVLDTPAAVDGLFAVWSARAAAAEALRARVDEVCARAAAPFIRLTESPVADRPTAACAPLGSNA